MLIGDKNRKNMEELNSPGKRRLYREDRVKQPQQQLLFFIDQALF